MIKVFVFLVFSAAILSAQQFNADSAFHFLQEQVNFGPRNPNSAGHEKCAQYLQEKLSEYTEKVETQKFSVYGYGEQLNLKNIIGRINPGLNDRLLLCAHWDTRPRADRDITNKDKPIPGAHDGASGVAILLEIARVLKMNDPGIGIDIIFFDGEDYGLEHDLDQFFHGSRYFSKNVNANIYREGILLDMVGDKNLTIDREYYSSSYAKEIQDKIWKIAYLLGMNGFRDKIGYAIQDDHILLNEAGIPTIDIIDFEYPGPGNKYWHTHNDTVENCSAESLFQVGAVVLEYIYSR